MNAVGRIEWFRERPFVIGYDFAACTQVFHEAHCVTSLLVVGKVESSFWPLHHTCKFILAYAAQFQSMRNKSFQQQSQHYHGSAFQIFLKPQSVGFAIFFKCHNGFISCRFHHVAYHIHIIVMFPRWQVLKFTHTEQRQISYSVPLCIIGVEGVCFVEVLQIGCVIGCWRQCVPWIEYKFCFGVFKF